MLCTDGLTNELPLEKIVAILESNTAIESKVESLQQKALEAGGKDNITVMIAQV